jgi:hypothetical protein
VAKAAAEALQNVGFDGHVLVTMGDKFIEPEAIDAEIARIKLEGDGHRH